MFRSFLILFLIAGFAWGTSAVAAGPIDDESCDEGSDDGLSGHILGCRLGHVVASTEDGEDSLVLEGRFCDEPSVSVSGSDGTFDPLGIVYSAPSRIVADWTDYSEPGTRAVIVECPCATCSLDITSGISGPTGPRGPGGATGPQGPLGP